nr:MAG TPA: hypothetical protein [Caudoviricetes sp.]
MIYSFCLRKHSNGLVYIFLIVYCIILSFPVL